MALLTTALTVPLAAEKLVLELDPARTEVSFDLAATGHDVHGLVGLERGSVRFDRESGVAEGEIVLDPAAARTGSESRDQTMRNKVLEVARFPVLRFVAERVVGNVPASGAGELELRGWIDLHGERHELALPAKVTVEGGRLVADANVDIPYQEWGLHDPSIFFLRVAEVVSVHVHADGRLEPAVVASASRMP
jgi:polyisoprenoid-binding protein YceI